MLNSIMIMLIVGIAVGVLGSILGIGGMIITPVLTLGLA